MNPLEIVILTGLVGVALVVFGVCAKDLFSVSKRFGGDASAKRRPARRPRR